MIISLMPTTLDLGISLLRDLQPQKPHIQCILDIDTDFPLTLMQMNRLHINLCIATWLLAPLPMSILHAWDKNCLADL